MVTILKMNLLTNCKGIMKREMFGPSFYGQVCRMLVRNHCDCGRNAKIKGSAES